jgi:RNA polymerase sigma factor (sigma-70 family)
MQVIVRTDRHTAGSDEWIGQVEAEVEGKLDRFGERLTRVEVHLSDENSRSKFGDHDKRCVMEARLAGLQPIVARSTGSSLEQAVSGAADKLAKTLKRTLGRKDSLFKRRARARVAITAAGPVLERDALAGQREHFLTTLRPLLGTLRDHARHELQILELDGTLQPGALTADELLDEVVTRAWLRFPDRPQRVSLDLWLVHLLHETLEDRIDPQRRRPRSLDQDADALLPEDALHVDDQEWWLWLLGEDEEFARGETTPDHGSAMPEEQFAAEELNDRIHALLGTLPKARRQAFVLNTLEAYDPIEIAMLQNRPESEVQADIEAARKMLHDRLHATAPPRARAAAANVAPSTALP